MRPSDKWNRNPKASKRKQGKKDEFQSDMIEPQSDVYTDQPTTFYADPVDSSEQVDRDTEKTTEEQSNVPLPPTAHARRPRANSMQSQHLERPDKAQWTGSQLDAALHRAIQSSPARFQGTQESPIELEDDLTPKPTRRLLFPSPRKDGETKSLDDASLPTAKASNAGSGDPFNDGYQMNDKENRPPDTVEVDDFAHLFEGSPTGFMFKTPSKATPHAMKMTPPSQSIPTFESLFAATPTPSRRTVSNSHTNALLRTPNRTNIDAFLPTFSSSETKNLFPSTPSRYANLLSPSRNGSGGGGRSSSAEQMTPFTRHLTQMLSDANPDSCGLDIGGQMMMTGGTSMGAFSSPGKPFDFGTFLSTPGRNLGFDLGFGGEVDMELEGAEQ